MHLDTWLQSPFLDRTFPLPINEPFTAATALENGISRRDLARLVEVGLLRHPIKNCYVPASLPDDIPTRCACLRLVVPPDAVVVERHAG
ncbi:type IV toxin-antitoxin system AbiEi family antitoxin domain-containing protein [Nocardioides zeicaulis]|uniref:Type IV toxin-antitoxin system AbiEi family antitoxin domain-containing protein n=1 Tax=Nocardioides zeicaulis TaxID=1776857 RepID=A0ABV6DW79_9ACTN